MKKFMIIALFTIFYAVHVQGAQQAIVQTNGVLKQAMEKLELAKKFCDYDDELNSLNIALDNIRQNKPQTLVVAIRCLDDLAQCDKLQDYIRPARAQIQARLDSSIQTLTNDNSLDFNLLMSINVESDYFPAISWSPDGTKLAYISYSTKTLRIWDVHTKQEIKKLHFGSYITESLSRRISSESNPEAKAILEELLKEYTALTKIQRYRFGNLLKWTANSKSIVFNDLNYLINWNIDSDQKTCKKFVESKLILLSPDCSKYVTVHGKDVKIWNSSTLELLSILTGVHEAEVYSLAWSPNSKLLASGSVDSKIILWNPETGKAIRSLNEHVGSVNSLDWSKDLKKIVSCGNDELIFVRTFNDQNKQFEQTEELENVHHGDINSISFSPDSLTFASASADEIKVWSLDGQMLKKLSHPGKVMFVQWSPDGSKLAAISKDGQIKIYTKK